jgi:hypothetical protein
MPSSLGRRHLATNVRRCGADVFGQARPALDHAKQVGGKAGALMEAPSKRRRPHRQRRESPAHGGLPCNERGSPQVTRGWENGEG